MYCLRFIFCNSSVAEEGFWTVLACKKTCMDALHKSAGNSLPSGYLWQTAWFGMHRRPWRSVPVLPTALVSDWLWCSSFQFQSQSQLNTNILCLNQTHWERFRAQVQRKHCRLLVVVGVVHFLWITCSTYVQGSAALNPSLASSLISLLFWQRNGHVHLVNEETLVSRVMCCQDYRASVCPSACVPHWWRTETFKRPMMMGVSWLSGS